MKAAAILFGIFALSGLALLSYGMAADPAPEPSPVERIEAACAAQYPYEDEGRASCRLSLLMAHLDAQERARLERARREARL